MMIGLADRCMIIYLLILKWIWIEILSSFNEKSLFNSDLPPL